MNHKIAKQWAAALRSGDYKQGRHQLRKNDAFCCLGVLCNLHAQAHPKIAAQQPRPGLYMNQRSYLPQAVILWAGIKTGHDPHLPRPSTTPKGRNKFLLRYFTALNDTRRLAFNEIADLIDIHWKEI